jgi:hypothetical protein
MGEFSGARTGEPLEQRVARLEDVEAIKRLKAKYAEYCDTGYRADKVASLFTDDAVWESNAFGTARGRDEIHAFIDQAGREMIFWAHHSMVCQYVDVAEDGQSAHGKWYLIEFATMPADDGSGGNEAVLITATYEDDLVKKDGEWRFQYVGATFHQVSNWDQAWVKQRFRGGDG